MGLSLHCGDFLYFFPPDLNCWERNKQEGKNDNSEVQLTAIESASK